MKKIYNLQIAFNTDSDEVEYVSEWIDEYHVTAMLGEIDLADYFDEKTLNLIAESYEAGKA